MERWGVGVNGYYGKASIYRDRGSWWTFALEWLVDNTVYRLPEWEVPFIGRIPVWDKYDGEWTTIRDYYGVCLSCIVSLLVGLPILNWLHTKRVHRSINVSLEKLIRNWGDEAPAFWAEQFDEGTETWKEDGPPDPKHGTVYRDGTDYPSLPRKTAR